MLIFINSYKKWKTKIYDVSKEGTLTSVSVSLKLQKYFLLADHRTCKAYT